MLGLPATLRSELGILKVGRKPSDYDEAAFPATLRSELGILKVVQGDSPLQRAFPATLRSELGILKATADAAGAGLLPAPRNPSIRIRDTESHRPAHAWAVVPGVPQPFDPN